MLLGFVAAASTTPAISGRFLSTPVRRRITIVLPVLPVLAVFLIPGNGYSPTTSDFVLSVCAAFGFVYSIDNLRVPRAANRVVGSVFALLYSYVLFQAFKEAYAFYARAV